MDEMLILCRNLTYLRKSNRLSKKQMRKIAGVGSMALNLWENDIVPGWLHMGHLVRVCQHFGFPPKDLFHPLFPEM